MGWLRRKNRNDVMGGGLMVLIGGVAMLEGSSYTIGSLARMGPGFFPVALGAVVMLLGVLIAMTAADAGAPDLDAAEGDDGAPQWRGWSCVVAGIVAFIALGGWFGLMPATFALVFISAMGDSDQTVAKAFLLALGVTLVGAFIFTNLLQLQFPLIRWG